MPERWRREDRRVCWRRADNRARAVEAGEQARSLEGSRVCREQGKQRPWRAPPELPV
jgi:hypothetical protein